MAKDTRNGETKGAATATREALAALVVRLAGEAVACSPASGRDLLISTYRHRANHARRLGWSVPILETHERGAFEASLRSWDDFYLRGEPAAQRDAILKVTAHIARASGCGVFEIDPWDAIAWLDDVDTQTRDAARSALRASGFIPDGAELEVLSFVHAREQELSLRLFVSSVGFGDRGRHFLLRYFLDDALVPVLSRLFAERDPELWIEGNRLMFTTSEGNAADALLAFHELTESARTAMAESAGAMVMFCEMPPRIGRLAEMKPWGEIPLRHGVELFEVV